MNIFSKLVMMFLLVGVMSSYGMRQNSNVASMNIEQLRSEYNNALETVHLYEKVALVTGVVALPAWATFLHAFGHSIDPVVGGLIALTPMVLTIGICKVMSLRSTSQEQPDWN